MTLSAISSYENSILLRCALGTSSDAYFFRARIPCLRFCPVSFYSASFLLAASACAAPRAIRRFEASRPCASKACCRWSISPLACDHPGTVYRMHLHSIVGIPCSPFRCGNPIIARSLEAPSASPQGTCSRCLDSDHPAPSCAADRVLSDHSEREQRGRAGRVPNVCRPHLNLVCRSRNTCDPGGDLGVLDRRVIICIYG